MFRTIAGRVPAVVLFLLICAAARAHAQGPAFVYRYDSTFRFGAHLARHPEVEKDTLHFDFGSFYSEPFLGMNTAVVRDTALWPFTANPNSLYEWRVDKALYDKVDTMGFDVTFAPSVLSALNESAYSIENFYGRITDTVSLSSFAVQMAYGDHDSLKSSYVFGRTVPSGTPATDTLVAGQSRYTFRGMKPSDSTLYLRAGLPNERRYFDLTYTIKSDSLSDVDSTTVIAYGHLWIRDTTGQSGPGQCHCNFYTKVDSFPVTKAKYLASPIVDSSGYRDVTFTFDYLDHTDSIEHWKWAPQYNFGGGAATTDSSVCGDSCNHLLIRLRSEGKISSATEDIPTTVDGGDVWYDFYSTRQVPVTFLKGRIGPHLLSVLAADSLDTLIDAAVDAVYADSLLRRHLFRVGIQDEPVWERFVAYRLLDSRVQRRMGTHGTDGPIGLWSNPYQDFATFRAVTGDFDSTQVKMIQQMAVQPYIINQQRLPVFYADPDRMHGSEALFHYYRVHDIGGRPRIIAYNDTADYRAYDDSMLVIVDSKITSFVDAIQTSRHRFAQFPNARPYPVYPAVESHGYHNVDEHGAETYRRIPTPEEITAQAWAALGLRPDGLMFSDFEWDHYNLGMVHKVTGAHDSDYATMYDPSPAADSSTHYPPMWIGMKSRFDAVRSVTDEFQLIKDTYTRLDYDPVFWLTYRDTSGARTHAVLDTLFARRARLYDTTAGGSFVDSSAVEPWSQTRLALSWFTPGPGLPAEAAQGVRYLMVTNLRCWPVDRTDYGDTTHAYGDPFGQQDFGFGAIDVRKPVVRFKNDLAALADSFRIERVGHEGSWSRTVVASDTAQLDWLRPGQGMLFRITPVARGISPYGTAFNNAVHAENPSTDTRQRDRFMVYERDSIVYLRTVDSTGTWSQEWRISDAADTVKSKVAGVFRRAADNFTPAMATMRDGSYAMIVWERRAPDSTATVELCWLDSLPTRRGLPDTLRRRLTAPKNLGSYPSLLLGPSVVGLDSGFVAAWASPGNGIDVTAIAAIPSHGDPGLDDSDTAHAVHVKMASPMPDNAGGTTAIDSICQWPTLAYDRRWMHTCINCSNVTISAGLTPNPYVSFTQAPLAPQVYGDFNVHLAYQQGPVSGYVHHIMYNQLRATFASFPQIVPGPTERVSWGLAGCDFLHPSIAVDSARIGVAFQIDGREDRSIALRFRDTLTKTGNWVQPWSTVTYRWGGSVRQKLGYGSPIYYERPSLTEFPSALRSQLTTRAEGGLVWQWTNAPGGRRNREVIYRYNWTQPDTSLPDGEFPSMMLVPMRSSALFTATGVFHRADTTQRRTLTRQLGGTALFYSGYLENAPGSPVRFFQTPPDGRGIYSNYKLLLTRYVTPWCEKPARLEHALSIVPESDADGFPAGVVGVPGLSPYFFDTPAAGLATVDSLGAIGKVARTGVFKTGIDPVTVRRIALGSDGLLEALNLAPVDSVTLDSADVTMFMEVVRAGDSVVIWRGDTLTARSLGSTGYDDAVSVPVDSVAAPGTDVFIRLNCTTTRGLEYGLEGGFEFLEDSSDVGFARRSRLTGSGGTAEGVGRMSIEVIPNPVRATAELRLSVPVPGMLDLALFDMIGRNVMELDPVSIDRAGRFSTSIDVRSLANGMYTVYARVGDHVVTRQISIAR
jgi:hypothetical protein